MKIWLERFSILMFASVVITILVYPFLFKHIVGTSKHGLISGLVFFACCSIVYGLGFVPKSNFIKILINPFVSNFFIILFYYLILF
jgi:hypothetical protein